MPSGGTRSLQFTSANSPALEACGVEGTRVTVRLKDSRLEFRGNEGGRFSVPAAQVTRIRQFRMAPVRTLPLTTPLMHETKIWWIGGARPALLIPIEGHAAYRAVIADFAAQVVAAHGLDRLGIGPGYTTAIVNLVIVGVPCLFLIALVFWIALLDGGWWWLGAAVIFMVFSWLAGSNLLSRWPRRVRSLDQFVAELR